MSLFCGIGNAWRKQPMLLLNAYALLRARRGRKPEEEKRSDGFEMANLTVPLHGMESQTV